MSDAGTPLLSDPGYLLVRAAIAAGVVVEPLPGASASLAALVVSGLPPYPFTTAGFPPPKRGRRKTFYRRFADLGHTLVVFESPHRIVSTLQILSEIAPEALPRRATDRGAAPVPSTRTARWRTAGRQPLTPTSPCARPCLRAPCC